MIKNKELMVHFGGSYAGPAPKEFLNYDSSPTLRFERIPLIGKLYKKNKGTFTDGDRLDYARQVFSLTSSYDAMISNYFNKGSEEELNLSYKVVPTLLIQKSS